MALRRAAFLGICAGGYIATSNLILRSRGLSPFEAGRVFLLVFLFFGLLFGLVAWSNRDRPFGQELWVRTGFVIWIVSGFGVSLLTGVVAEVAWPRLGVPLQAFGIAAAVWLAVTFLLEVGRRLRRRALG
jgi:hypothetical protein